MILTPKKVLLTWIVAFVLVISLFIGLIAAVMKLSDYYDQRERKLLHQHYAPLKDQILEIVSEAEDLPPAFDRLRHEMIQWAFFYCKYTKTSYLVVNMNQYGDKILYSCSDGAHLVYRRGGVRNHEDDWVGAFLFAETGSLKSLAKFNDMESMLPVNCINCRIVCEY